METVKLINKNGEIIERLKIQYEPNEKIWTERGWSLYDGKPKAERKEEPKVEVSGDPDWQPEVPKKKKKSKKKAK